ncbi:hypothetical protein [Pseudoalteromonas agarivorans]|uniref:hypothetical protein n=1 Tax=Pseudoalteromonas agarivorans TaxID=176102 RepID=UPI0013CF30D2|nr:hypothetical protein [Pseudoalteromonas agarivorans]
MSAIGTLQPLDNIKCDNNWQGILLCRMALRLSDLHLHKAAYLDSPTTQNKTLIQH